MKKITASIFVVAALFAISANAVTVIKKDGTVYQTEQESSRPKTYSSSPYQPYKPVTPKLRKNIPSTTHVYPNGHGGYMWTEPGNSDSDNPLERLPEGHSIKPDGHGGYYVN